MPSSVNGFGTKYYGQRDFRPDGSYVTTNFICLLFLPVFPIHSVRVIPDPKNSWVPFSKNYYAILEKRWPNPLQVLSIYAWAAAAAAMGILYFWKIEPFLKESAPWLTQSWVVPILFAACMGIPVAAGVLLRNMLRQRQVEAVDFSAK
jgi:hypothetical protein